MLPEGTVILKTCYAPAETIFVKLILSDGREVETCDVHIVDGHPAITYQAGDRVAGATVVEQQVSVRHEATYDLLTSTPTGGYTSHGIPIASMIPLLHKIAHELEVR